MSENKPLDKTQDAPRPTRRFKLDLLSLSLILVMLLNIGLYIGNMATENRKDDDSQGAPAQSQKNPGHEGDPDPDASRRRYFANRNGDAGGPAPDDEGEMPSGESEGRAPGSGGGGMANGPMDLATALTTLEGQVALSKLEGQPQPLGLTTQQKERVAAVNKLRMGLRNIGAAVSTITAQLSQEQLDYLRAHKGNLQGDAVPPGDPVRLVLDALKTKAGDKSVPASTEGTHGPPEFNPESLACGILLLEKEGGTLALTPDQASVVVRYMETLVDYDKFNGESPEDILNENQINFLMEELDLLPSPEITSPSKNKTSGSV